MKANLIKYGAIVAALGMVVIAATARAGDAPENHGQLSAADYKFAAAAARGSMMEVNLGKIAGQKSADSNVQQFGQRMVTEHGKAGDQLKQLATQKGAALPTDVSAMQQKHIDHLSGLTGSEFDRAYISMMIKDHKADLKEFQHAASAVQDPDLKAFANNTIPMIQGHLKQAESINEGFKVQKVSSNDK